MAALLTMVSLEEQPLVNSFNKVFLGAAGTDTDTGPSDDQFNRVSFLSHFEGANNGVNNAFDDGSTSNHTVTAAGNVTQGSFGPFARPDGEFGGAFDGDGDYLTVASSSDFDFGTGNFTWECFVYQTSRSNFQAIMLQDDYPTGNSISCWLSDSGQASIYYEGGSTHFTTTATVPLNTWTHLAWVRKGTGTNEFSIYINGTAQVSGAMNTSFDQDGISIGQKANGTFEFIGNISNVRIVKGTAVYTGNFTLPASKLTAITNTKLLTCQSNRFVDNSASAHTVTQAGNAAVTSFGPFLTSRVYAPARHGASAYFDGTGDYLTVATSQDFNLGTNDFTISAWVYSANNNSIGIIGDMNNSGDTDNYQLWWNHSANQIRLGTANLGNYVGWSVTLHLNSWNNILVSRASGAIKFFFNGTEITSRAADVGDLDGAAFNAMTPAYIGRFNDGAAQLNGYMTDVRIIKGSAVNPSGVPTAPLTAITNTKLLLNMADGQAFDSAAQSNLYLGGNAKISTGQAKFGDTSLALDGAGDYAEINSSNVINFGSGPFTIEMFLRLDSGSTNKTEIFFDGRGDAGDQGLFPTLEVKHTDDTVDYYTNGNIKISSGTLTRGQFYHIAVCRSGTSTKMFIDGTQVGSTYSDSAVYISSSKVQLGRYHSSTNHDFHGEIDELRISKMARYTSNFTAPSAAFADKGQ